MGAFFGAVTAVRMNLTKAFHFGSLVLASCFLAFQISMTFWAFWHRFGALFEPISI
jgi:hypothetical protein